MTIPHTIRVATPGMFTSVPYLDVPYVPNVKEILYDARARELRQNWEPIGYLVSLDLYVSLEHIIREESPGSVYCMHGGDMIFYGSPVYLAEWMGNIREVRVMLKSRDALARYEQSIRTGEARR